MNSSEIESVANELQSITVGAPTHFGGLTISPLFRNGSAPVEPGYTLLEEAVARDIVFAAAFINVEAAGRGYPLVAGIEAQHYFAQRHQVPAATLLRSDRQWHRVPNPVR